MNVEIINPFINAVISTFETMVGLKPILKSPYVKNGSKTEDDITGVIGFTESSINGSVALSFPIRTALRVYNAMMGENKTEINQDVQDLIGELTNIVANDAKQSLAKMDMLFHVSIPTIIVGKDYSLRHQLSIPVIAVPFSIDKDSFTLEISIKTE
ncbi:chemotaxis protein CheX [bacterium]|nr:chemotaxis protein CheX [bacterium]